MFDNIFFLLQVFIASLMLAGGFFSLILYFGDKRLKSNLHLANVSFVMMFYSISHIFWFVASDIESFVIAEKFANYIIITAIYPFIYYLQTYTGYKKNKLFYATMILFTSFYLVNYLLPYGLSYSEIEELRPVETWWGGTIYSPSVKLGAGGYAVIAGMVMLFTYMIQSMRHLNKTRPDEVRTLIWVFSVLIGAVIVDFILISLEIANFLYLQEFTYVMFLFLVAVKNFEIVLTGRRLEDELQYKNLDYKVITEKAGDIIFKLDSDFRIKFVSLAIKKNLEYDYTELIGENFKDLIYEDDYSLLEESLSENRETLVCRMLSKDQNIRWMSTSFSRLVNADHSAVEYILISRDITEEAERTRAIEEQSKLLRSIITSSPYILYIFDFQDFAKIYSHQQLEKMLGYTVKEFEAHGPKPFEAIMHPDDLVQLSDSIKRWDNSDPGEVVETEYRMRHKNGSYKWFKGSDVVFRRDENGRAIQILGAAQDITQQKLAQFDLEESERRLRALSESSFEGILMSMEGIIFDCNQHFLNMHGLTMDEVIGRRVGENLPSEVQVEVLRRIFTEDSSVYRTYSCKKNGELFPVEIRAKSILLNGKSIRISVIRDISEQIEKENQLLTAKEEAEKSNQLKTDFLTQISHEIRSPIHTILSFAGFIRGELEGKVGDEILESLDSMDTAGRRITRTVDLILNMSQVNTGTFEIKKDFVPILHEVISPILKEYEILAKEKGLIIKLGCGNCPPGIEAFVDEYSLKQIIQNLVDNAIKYTEQGEISVSGILDDEKFSLIIEDTGIGISGEYLPNLFSQFSQEEQGYTRRYDGNGLGLALVKKYCEFNNIDIFVESEKGKGSKFILVFNDKIRVVH